VLGAAIAGGGAEPAAEDEVPNPPKFAKTFGRLCSPVLEPAVLALGCPKLKVGALGAGVDAAPKLKAGDAGEANDGDSGVPAIFRFGRPRIL
jgi:hypothetical protein